MNTGVRWQRILPGSLQYLLLTLVAIIVIFPLWSAFTISMLNDTEVASFPPLLAPTTLHLTNFARALEQAPLLRYLFNSIVQSSIVMVGQLVTASLAAYAFARMNFQGRNLLFVLLLATLMIHGHVTMIPTFNLFNALGWVNTHYPLFIPAWFGGAFGTFLIRQFFLTVPQDYSDAAAIDGAGHFRIFTAIFLPLAKPVVATLALFTFMGHWNEFLLPVIYLTDPDKMTLTVGLSPFRQQYTTLYHYLMAGTLLSIIPILVLFVVLQKYFVRGIVMSGIKG